MSAAGHDWWEFQCGRHTTATACDAAHGGICIWTAGSCAGAVAGTLSSREFNCSAGSTLGTPGHLRHLLPASARLWNPWSEHHDSTIRAFGREQGWTDSSVDANMAMMIGRLLSPWNETVLADDHMDFYIEAAIIGTPRFSEGVHFVIAAFPDIFGTGVGRAVQEWCMQHGWVLVWALGKNLGDAAAQTRATGVPGDAPRKFRGNHRASPHALPTTA